MPGYTPQNLVPNPWPDTAVTGWSTAGASGVGMGGSPLTVAGMSRARSVSFFRNNLAAGIVSGRSPLAMVKEGKVYTARIDLRVLWALAANSGAFVSIAFYDTNQNYLTESKRFVLAAVAADTPFTVSSVGWAPKGAVYASVLFSVPNGPAVGTNMYATAARIDAVAQRGMVYADGDTSGWAWGSSARNQATGPAVVRAPVTGSDALQTRCLSELNRWKNWLDDNAAQGHVGEYNTCTVWEYYGGAGATTNQQPFMNLLTAYLNGLQYYDLAGTAWASGREFDQGYPLSLQTGTAVNTALTVTKSANALIAAKTSDGQRIQGTNLSGAEAGVTIAGGGTVRSAAGLWHTEADIQFVAASGIEVIRLPIAWERMQPTLNAALSTTELSNLRNTLAYCQKYQVRVILDLHNYGRYTLANGTTVYQLGDGNGTTAALADFWVKMSAALATNALDNQTVIGFDIMNEPNGLTAGALGWETASQSIVVALRNANDWRPLYIEGYTFSNLYEWRLWHPDGWISDPAANFFYSAHHYWDTQSVNTSAQPASRSGQWQQKNTAGTGQETMTYETERAAAAAQTNWSSQIVENFNTYLPAAAESPRTGVFKNQYGPGDQQGGAKPSGQNGVYNGRYRLYSAGTGAGLYGSGVVSVLATQDATAGTYLLDEIFFGVTAVPSQSATPTNNLVQMCWRSGNVANGSTRLMFELNRKTNQINIGAQVNYGYTNAVTTLTYDPVAMRYLKFAKDGANVIFQTSPSGLAGTWVTRRTEAAPAWVSVANQSLQIIFARDGAPDQTYFEIDCINSQSNADPAYSTRFFASGLDGRGNYTGEHPTATPVWRQDMGKWFRYASGLETTLPATTGGSGTTQRCELIPEGRGITEYLSAGRHMFGLGLYLGPTFPVDFPSWQLITQLKNEGSGSPPWQMKIGNGRLFMDGNSGGWTKDVCAVKPGRTYKIVIDMTMAETAAGSAVSVWVNGELMVDNWSPTGAGFLYAGARNYWKVGLYRDNATAGRAAAQVVWGEFSYDQLNRNRVVNHTDDTMTNVVDSAIGRVSERQVLFPETGTKSVTVGTRTTWENPKRLVSGPKSKFIGLLQGRETPRALAPAKTRSIGRVSEQQTSYGLLRGSRNTPLGGTIVEGSDQFSITTGSRSTTLGRINSREVQYRPGRSWSKLLTRVVGRETVRGLTGTKTATFTRALSRDRPVGVARSKRQTLVRVAERAAVASLGRSRSRSVAAIREAATVAMMGRSKTAALTTQVLRPVELSTVRRLVGSKTVTLLRVRGIELVGRMASSKNRALVRTDGREVGRRLVGSKTTTITRISSEQRSLGVEPGFSRPIHRVREVETARTVGGSKSWTIGAVRSVQTTGRLTGRKSRLLARVTGGQIVEWLIVSKSRTLTRVISREMARRMIGTKTRSISTGESVERPSRMSGSKSRVLGRITEAESGRRLNGRKRVVLMDVMGGQQVRGMGRSKTHTLGRITEGSRHAAPYLGSTVEIGRVAHGELIEYLRGSKSTKIGQVRSESEMRLAVARSKEIGQITEGVQLELYFDTAFVLGRIVEKRLILRPLRSTYESGTGNKAYHENNGPRARQEPGRRIRAYHV